MTNIDMEKIKELRKKASALPLDPGVYLVHDKAGTIIYVGKAKELRKRVISYFTAVDKHLPKVYQMVSQVEEFDFIVTRNENEAFVLEASLIKLHMPKYNILLKDDKGYAYIRIAPGPYPKITAEKSKPKDGTILGPYLSLGVVQNAVEEVNRIFKLPSCKRVFPRDFGKGRPCLNYHIGKCRGICQGNVSEQEYMEIIRQAEEYLRFGSKKLTEQLRRDMAKAAEELDFERAAELRDRINIIDRISAEQTVILQNEEDADALATVFSDGSSCTSVVRFRGGRLVDKEDLIYPIDQEETAFRNELITRFYTTVKDIPRKVMLDKPIPDSDLLAEYLTEELGKKVTVTVPQRGTGLQMIALAKANAAERLGQQTSRTSREVMALTELGSLLGIPPPERIEAVDISNFGDSGSVGAMVTFVKGKPSKQDYKRFMIKTVIGVDDYASTKEVLTRRFQRYLDGDEKFSPLPDLLLLDGGEGHLSAAKEVMESLGIDIPAFGMVKDTKHRTRAIAAGGREISLTANRSAFTLVSTIQEEVHRFAISYQRQNAKVKGLALELTRIPGVGENTAIKLLKHFKTVGKLREANLDEITAVKGINKSQAKGVYDYLHQTGD